MWQRRVYTRFFRSLLAVGVLAIGLSATDADDLAHKTYVVGDSRDQIIATLRASYTTPICFGDYLEAHAPRFEGVRYGAGGAGCGEYQTLINVKQMDCVTFVENMLALATTSRELHAQWRTADTAHFSDDYLLARFVHHLNAIRYYQGTNCGWESRIHYFTDALRQLADNQLALDVGQFLGEAYTKRISYLSDHKRAFPGIDDWEALGSLESELSSAQRFFVPLSEIYRYEQFAQTGDIVALATDVQGLDVSHVGFMHVENGELYMTHASSKNRKVELKVNFCDYMGRRTTITGLVVYRPVL